MKLLCPVIDIYQKQVVQNQILEEIVPVKPFLISNDQILNLADCNLADHICIIIVAARRQDICHLAIVQHLQKVISADHLAICRRCGKARNNFTGNLNILSRCSHLYAIQVEHINIDLGNCFQFIDTRLNDLI